VPCEPGVAAGLPFQLALGVMNRELAEQFEVMSREFEMRLGVQLLKRAKEQCSEEEFVEIRKSVAYVLGALLTHIHTPIYSGFPELKPKQLGGSYEVPEFEDWVYPNDRPLGGKS
jgi:hypothetical protein